MDKQQMEKWYKELVEIAPDSTLRQNILSLISKGFGTADIGGCGCCSVCDVNYIIQKMIDDYWNVLL